VFVQRVQVISLIFIIPDISITLSGEEKDVIVAPEGHHDARRLIQRDRLDVLQRSNLPHAHLPIAHPAKSRRSDTIAVSHPDHTRALDAAMALSDAYGFSASAGIEQAQFAIAGGCRE
jgi:hypothetical protein